MAKQRRGVAPHVGRPVTIDALGKTWTLARWEMAEWDAFADEYAAKVLPDPRQVGADMLKVMPGEHHDTIVRLAYEDAMEPLGPGNPRVTNLLNTIKGSSYMLFVLLRKNHPDVTHSDAWNILMDQGMAIVNSRMEKAAGIAPRPKGRRGSPASPSPQSPSAVDTATAEPPGPPSTDSSVENAA